MLARTVAALALLVSTIESAHAEEDRRARARSRHREGPRVSPAREVASAPIMAQCRQRHAALLLVAR
jgi:hypothetical protein